MVKAILDDGSTRIETTYTDRASDRTPLYNLAFALAKAIRGYDAAEGGGGLEKWLMEALQELKPKPKPEAGQS